MPPVGPTKKRSILGTKIAKEFKKMDEKIKAEKAKEFESFLKKSE